MYYVSVKEKKENLNHSELYTIFYCPKEIFTTDVNAFG